MPPGAPVDSLPVIQGLILDDLSGFFVHSPTITLNSLHFVAPVRNTFDSDSYSNPLIISFNGCVLDSGLTDAGATFNGQLDYYWRYSTIDGPISLRKPEGIYMDTCVVHAPVNLSSRVQFAYIRGCTFVPSDPTATCMSIDDVGDVNVEGCSFSHMRVGIHSNASELTVLKSMFTGPADAGVVFGWILRSGFEDDVFENLSAGIVMDTAAHVVGGGFGAGRNVFRDCARVGMEIVCGYLGIADNDFLRCGDAAILSSASASDVERNRVESCLGSGLRVECYQARVRNNLVGHCGLDGMVVTVVPSAYYSGAPSFVRNNTTFQNGGTGLRVASTDSSRAVAIDHNIAYQNHGFGLTWQGAQSPVLGCNDWFGNDSGAVSGATATGDRLIDPQFCAVDTGDVHLAGTSPLADTADCGLVGALGVGCAPTATLLSRFTAERTPAGVVLRWITGFAPGALALERAASGTGPWAPLDAPVEQQGEASVAVDRAAPAGREIWYRLTARGASLGVVQVTGEVAEFALAGITPNPSTGPVLVEFRLPRAADVQLAVYDVQGRMAAVLARGVLAPGTHTAEWPGVHRPGFYFVRFRHPGGQQTRSLLVLR